MRNLYLWFLLAFAIMAYGFWPSLRGEAGLIDGIRWVHGALAAGWMALLVAQSWLIGHGCWRLHGRFGRASRYLVPMLVISSLFVVHDMLGPRSHFDRELRLTLAWGDIVSLALFSGFYIAAIVCRRQLQLHARFMASTVFIVLPPALGRAYGPIFGGLAPALDPSYWTVELALAGLIALDGVHRRFLAPFPLALLGTILLQATMWSAPHFAPFLALAGWLGLPSA